MKLQEVRIYKPVVFAEYFANTHVDRNFHKYDVSRISAGERISSTIFIYIHILEFHHYCCYISTFCLILSVCRFTCRDRGTEYTWNIKVQSIYINSSTILCANSYTVIIFVFQTCCYKWLNMFLYRFHAIIPQQLDRKTTRRYL